MINPKNVCHQIILMVCVYSPKVLQMNETSRTKTSVDNLSMMLVAGTESQESGSCLDYSFCGFGSNR